MTTNPPLHLLGPTNIGKGFMTHLLQRALKLQHSIQIGIVSVGDEVRQRFADDHAFKQTYEPVIAKGHLVPDHEVIPMFDQRLNVVRNEKLVVTDGFLRNATQVEHAGKTNLLERGSASVIMHGSRSTCHNRLLHRMEQKPNGKRIDEHAFQERYELHQNSIQRIQGALVHTGTQVFHVDANGDLEKDVFPQMLTFAECVLFRHFQHEPRDFMLEAFKQHMEIHRSQVTA